MIVKEILRTIFMFLIGIMYVIKCLMLCNYLFVVVKKITYDLIWVDNLKMYFYSHFLRFKLVLFDLYYVYAFSKALLSYLWANVILARYAFVEWSVLAF